MAVGGGSQRRRPCHLVLRMTNGNASAKNDPYMQPIKVADKAGNPDVSHIIPGMIWPTSAERAEAIAAGLPAPQPRRKAAPAPVPVPAAGAAAGAAMIPRKVGEGPFKLHTRRHS